MWTAIEDGFVAQLPAIPPSPVVVSVPHAGIATVGFENALAPELDVRCDADLHVDRLYRIGEPSAPSAFVAARLSRFVCDLNRDPDDVGPGAVPLHRDPRNADGRGFIWAVTTAGSPALSRPLSLEDWRARTSIHAAYHDAITRALNRARDRFGFAVLVDGHSMPSRGRQGHKDPGRERADVVPGDRDGSSCSPALSRLVGGHFAERGYRVAFNDPYKGGFITTHHGRPAEHIHAIQIELRRDLYMNESTYTIVDAGFQRLRSAIDDLLAKLETFQP
ncbi:MAG TPA: N-formylglutamate amidohydrolase [Polyangia bacterium]|jgi:N-formylglutamate deformylase|nr:N-formylglutamate amidohydrolase [Polyangia bacterium]